MNDGEEVAGDSEEVIRDEEKVIAHWRSDLKQDMRPGERMGTYFARVDSDTIEDRFLYDSVAWSVFSHNLKAEDNPLHFRLEQSYKKPADTFKLAVLQGNIYINRKSEGGEQALWLDKTHGALRSNCSDPPTFDELRDVFIEQLTFAIDAGADVIMAGEFAYPSSDDPDETASLESAVRDVLRETTRPIFLVAGTLHTPSAHGTEQPHNANVAMLYGGDPSIPGYSVALDNEQPVKHFKRSPSIAIGERIYSPVDAQIPLYRTPFCNFGLLVCSDAFDTQILFSFLRQNKRMAARSQVILVPAYNTSELFYDSCRYLSYLANATVVVLNTIPTNFPSGCVKIFTAGIEADDRANCMSRQSEEFGNMEISDHARIVDATKELSASGSEHISLHGLGRNVALYQFDRVQLENFAKILLKKGGRLVKKARDFHKANK